MGEVQYLIRVDKETKDLIKELREILAKEGVKIKNEKTLVKMALKIYSMLYKSDVKAIKLIIEEYNDGK